MSTVILSKRASMRLLAHRALLLAGMALIASAAMPDGVPRAGAVDAKAGAACADTFIPPLRHTGRT